MIWLAGNSFYGRKQIFEPEFLAWLADFQLPEYELTQARRPVSSSSFAGPWMYTTMWEIPALAIINELRSRTAMKEYGPFTLDVLYARAKAKLWAKVERLQALPGPSHLRFRHAPAPLLPLAALVRRGAEGRHRRRLHRHQQRASSPWTTTSRRSAPTRMSCRWCWRRWPRPTPSCMPSPYQVLQDWQRYYGGNLLIVLPDAFGTAAFLRNAPDWVAELDRLPAGQRAADRGRREDHRVVAHEGAGPERASC